MTDQLWALFAFSLAVLLLSLGMWRRGKTGKDGGAGGDGGVWFGGDSSGGDCGGGDGGGGD